MRKKLENKKVKLISAAAGFPSPAENYIEEQLRNKNIKLEDTSLEEMDKLWNDAKLH